jgi:TatD DNase family protein
MIDTHAHVNFNSFKDDFDEIIKRAIDKKIAIINIGSQFSTSKRAVDLAQKYDKVYAAIGLHPIHLQDLAVEEEDVTFTTRKEEFSYEIYRALALQNKVVAIGETGLDYYHLSADEPADIAIERQKKVFHEHIKLANELSLPIIVHCRGDKDNADAAYAEILEELKQNAPKHGGVMHCYGGPVDLVPKFISLGFYVSFNGILTFDKTGRIEQILLKTPNDKILTETDCPFLTPAPYRGKRNEPAFVEFVVEKIAAIKQLPITEIDKLTTANAVKLFNL